MSSVIESLIPSSKIRYQPAHTMHTDADPSVRSIASSVLRNGELAAHPPPLWPHPAEPPGTI